MTYFGIEHYEHPGFDFVPPPIVVFPNFTFDGPPPPSTVVSNLYGRVWRHVNFIIIILSTSYLYSAIIISVFFPFARKTKLDSEQKHW